MEKLIYGETDLYYVGLQEGDKCPNCGSEFRTIPFFAGDISCVHKKLDPSVMEDTKIATVAYGDWVKCWGGYCSHCAETFHNDTGRLKMIALNSLKKLCIFIAVAIIGFLGFVFTEIWPFELVLFIGMFGIFPCAIMTLGDMATYLSRKPYVEPAPEVIEDNFISACNGRMNYKMVRDMLGKEMIFKPKDALVEEDKNDASESDS